MSASYDGLLEAKDQKKKPGWATTKSHCRAAVFWGWGLKIFHTLSSIDDQFPQALPPNRGACAGFIFFWQCTCTSVLCSSYSNPLSDTTKLLCLGVGTC